jgi:hypothetical protein
MPRRSPTHGVSVRHCCDADCPPSGRSWCLSGNDIEHALLALGAMYVGIPYAPISPAYSLMSNDFGKLRSIINLLTPGLIYATDGGPFARAIYEAVPDEIELVVARNPLGDRKTTMFAELLGAEDATGVRCRASRRVAGHDREIFVHLWLDRKSQSRHQHPSDAVLEPGYARVRFCLCQR